MSKGSILIKAALGGGIATIGGGVTYYGTDGLAERMDSGAYYLENRQNWRGGLIRAAFGTIASLVLATPFFFFNKNLAKSIFAWLLGGVVIGAVAPNLEGAGASLQKAFAGSQGAEQGNGEKSKVGGKGKKRLSASRAAQIYQEMERQQQGVGGVGNVLSQRNDNTNKILTIGGVGNAISYRDTANTDKVLTVGGVGNAVSERTNQPVVQRGGPLQFADDPYGMGSPLTTPNSIVRSRLVTN